MKLLPKRTKQITKYHELHEYAVVENVENLDVGCSCACVRASVCVRCPSLRCAFAARSLREVWSCLCLIHMKQTPRDSRVDNAYIPANVSWFVVL